MWHSNICDKRWFLKSWHWNSVWMISSPIQPCQMAFLFDGFCQQSWTQGVPALSSVPQNCFIKFRYLRNCMVYLLFFHIELRFAELHTSDQPWPWDDARICFAMERTGCHLPQSLLLFPPIGGFFLRNGIWSLEGEKSKSSSADLLAPTGALNLYALGL